MTWPIESESKNCGKKKNMVKFQLNQNAKKRAHLCFDNPLKVYKKIGENEVSCHLQNGMKKKKWKSGRSHAISWQDSPFTDRSTPATSIHLVYL